MKTYEEAIAAIEAAKTDTDKLTVLEGIKAFLEARVKKKKSVDADEPRVRVKAAYEANTIGSPSAGVPKFVLPSATATSASSFTK